MSLNFKPMPVVYMYMYVHVLNLNFLSLFRCSIPHTELDRRERKAMDIKNNYLNKKYFFGPNSPAGRAGQKHVREFHKFLCSFY